MKKKSRYKILKRIDKDTKKKLIIISIFLVMIIVMSFITSHLEKKENNEKNNNSQYSSIEEILNKYGCTYIKEIESKDSNFSIDIYLKFKYKTFEQNQSKKRYYENLIGNLTGFIQKNFRLIDEEKNILIEIKNNGTTYLYTINGKDDYFQKEEAKLNLENYEQEKNTNFEINSSELQSLLNNDWGKNVVDFGTKDSTFDKYDIYFDEGIEVRNISKKVFNIVFTQRYNKQVVNEILPGSEFEEIVSKLGEPTYGAKEGYFIGYKNSQMYIFFTKEEIYIYRNEKNDMAEFEKILAEYVDNKIDIKEFMNELTYIWPDYEEYIYDSNSIYINYPIHGITIDMTKDTPFGIYIYKNCNITENIAKLIGEEKISGRLTEDLIDKTMENKITYKDEKIYMASLREDAQTENISDLYYLYYDTDDNNLITDILFISKNNNIPNRELKDKIDQGFFINDDMFVYSISNKGIYLLNITTNEKTTIATGKQEFKIIEYKENILKYDNEEIKLIME